MPQGCLWVTTFALVLAMAMNCLGLALEWENVQELRERIRDQKRVLLYPVGDTYCKPTRQNAVSNSCVVKPILRRLQVNPRLPHLDDLIVEVTTLFEKCGLPFGEKAPYKVTVEVKRLAGFLKRRATRKEVTKEKG